MKTVNENKFEWKKQDAMQPVEDEGLTEGQRIARANRSDRLQELLSFRKKQGQYGVPGSLNTSVVRVVSQKTE